MTPREISAHNVATALRKCGPLKQDTKAWESLWFVVQDAICTRSMVYVAPLGSKTAVPVTAEHAPQELLAAMEWLRSHEAEARQLRPLDLFIRLRGVATRGASGSARAVRSDALHGMTNVSPGDRIVFLDYDWTDPLT